jgi:hypothetical protein
MLIAIDQLCNRTGYLFSRADPGVLNPVDFGAKHAAYGAIGLKCDVVARSRLWELPGHNGATTEMDAAAIAGLFSERAVRFAREKPDHHVRGKSLSPLATDLSGWHRPSFLVCARRAAHGTDRRDARSNPPATEAIVARGRKNGVASLPRKGVTTPIEFLSAG